MPAPIKPDSFSVSFFDEDRARKNFDKNGEYIIGYARLSFDEDGEGYCSIVNQREILHNYYMKKLRTQSSRYDFIADDNVSGYKFERDGLFTLLSRIEGGTCNIILAKDLSRIGRHGALTQLFIEQCERVGIRIVAMDDYDSHRQSDELILGIRAWSNERLVKDTSAKILKIVRHKQENGTWFCAAPYGYRVIDYAAGKVEIDEEAAAVVRRIAELYLSGKGINKIARMLTEEGVPTPSQHFRAQRIAEGLSCDKPVSEKWAASQLSKMLGDDFYIGTLRTAKYRRQGINGGDVRRPAEEQHVFEGHHAAILSRDTFEQIREVRDRKSRNNDRGSRTDETIFHGVLYCGDCGSKLYTYKRRDIERQYICSNHFKYGKKACTRHAMKESVLVKLVLQYLRKVRTTSENMIAELDGCVREEKKARERNRASRQSAAREIEALKSKLAVIEAQRVKQILHHPEREESLNRIYDDMHEQTLDQIDALEREAAFLSEGGAEDRASALKRAGSAVGIIDEILESGELTRRDVLVLIDRITVYESGEVVIELNGDYGMLSVPAYRLVDRAAKQPEKAFNVVVKGQDTNVVGDGDPLEIFTDHDGEVVLKKYSPIGEIAAIAKDYTDSLYRTLGHVALISDRDAIVSSSGAAKRDYAEKALSQEMDQLLSSRQQAVLNLASGARMLPVTGDDQPENYTAQVITPILADGEIIGGLFLLSRESGRQMTTIDQKVAETTANIIGRQMEQ